MNDELLVIPRVRDLLNDKMAYIDGEKYRLTPKAFLLHGCLYCPVKY